MTIWYILCSFGTFSSFGIMYQEKSGNPGAAYDKSLNYRRGPDLVIDIFCCLELCHYFAISQTPIRG
jgi:hypothetical protein